ncbi:MAG: UDP-N-acetylmuramoyl-L-alanine--D-glutamate ligase [Deltaproteobacteria bacterium]|nr:MAG: UDP-N-acetylmuramoyl-L-alanine--D-glutamate ligase [Deltaproteobacteria bacterium]
MRMELSNQRILVVGLGRSGFATACFAAGQGAGVTVTDMAPEKDLAEFAAPLRAMDVRLELGGHKPASFETADQIVISPGVPHTIAPVRRALACGVPVAGELEFAARFVREPMIAITGTNGKTTTTELTGRMLENSGFRVFTGGNIGTPLIAYADKGPRAQKIVLEVSSFQLDTVRTFHPHIAVVLNISPDHMDRYPDFSAYAKSKFRIFENQEKTDIAILNGSDPLIRKMARSIRSRKVYFAGQDRNHAGADIRTDGIFLDACFDMPGAADKEHTAGVASEEGIFLDIADISIREPHNLENVAAAGMAALAAGATPKGIRSALRGFRGLSHRIEHVATISNVRFFDDSKATNVDAVARALECFSDPVILIMGGRSKDSDFSVLGPLVRRHVKHLVLMGESGREIASALSGEVNRDPVFAVDMQEAVSLAGRMAASGDVVLLSPACASFDMFSSYAQRGEVFAAAVKQLK